MFGGYANRSLGGTWTFFTGGPASYATYGAGCSGTVGTPKLAPALGSLPWMGQTLTIELTGLPNAVFNAPFGIVGLSKTSWGATTLPLDLGFMGIPGCKLLVSPDLFVPLANLGGKASWSATVPRTPILIGAVFFQQGFVLDRGANPLGVVVSNAGEGKIGAK